MNQVSNCGSAEAGAEEAKPGAEEGTLEKIRGLAEVGEGADVANLMRQQLYVMPTAKRLQIHRTRTLKLRQRLGEAAAARKHNYKLQRLRARRQTRRNQ